MFRITLRDAEGGLSTLDYDPHRSVLAHADGTPVDLAPVLQRDADGPVAWPVAPRLNGAAAPGRKTTRIRRLKIQLGLKCNYECSYCLQRFQPGHDEGGAADVQHFLERLPRQFDGGEDGQGKGVRIEFWGGEPFLYFKSKLRLLGLALKSAYPSAEFAIVTNGSVLSDEILDWIDAMECSIALSHDGPGQPQRGPDPLAEPERKAWILRLYDRLAPHGRFSFNTTLTADNHDLDAIRAWFAERLDGRAPLLNLEGVALPYTAEGMASAIVGSAAQQRVMVSLMRAILQGAGAELPAIRRKLHDFFVSLRRRRPSTALGQKCGMDRADSLAVTLTGDVLTCQNVSPTAHTGAGEPHGIGRLDDLSAVRLTTAVHWSHRRECSTCPVLQLCQGSCMFLQGENWAQACDSEFAYNMGIFMAALHLLTGKVPVRIDGEVIRGQNFVRAAPAAASAGVVS